MKILVLGDLHGAWGALNDLIRKQEPDMVLQVGDFGYFPAIRDKRGKCRYDPQRWTVNGDVPVHFCPGNHEDHHALRRLEEEFGHRSIEVAPLVYYQPRGSSITLPDGRVVLFMGGAFSVDWQLRNDWCGDLELLHQEDLERIPDKVDIVVSHTCPRSFGLRRSRGKWPAGGDPVPDPSQDVLRDLLKAKNPARWYFGHLHWFQEGEDYGGCKWTLLAHVQGWKDRFWTWLED